MTSLATVEDLPALVALERACFEPAWPEEELRAELARPDARVVVWRAGAEHPVTGFIVYRDVIDELELLQVGVAPEARRAGVASALVVFLLNDARERRKGRVTLEVHAENLPARALYARLGFVPMGRRSGYYGDGGDALVMMKETPT